MYVCDIEGNRWRNQCCVDLDVWDQLCFVYLFFAVVELKEWLVWVFVVAGLLNIS